MQDLVWLAYIVLWLAAARFAAGVRFPVPRAAEVGGYVYLADQRPLGCMVVLFCVLGAGLGAYQPLVIYDMLFRDATADGWPADPLNGVGRLAQIVGGVCGAYVGVRAVRMWILLFLAWVAFQVLSHLVGYVAHG